jgi:2-polyprenyl-6-methoxyphenol hydroxylase-like FAD-dependent oxidoreductase
MELEGRRIAVVGGAVGGAATALLLAEAGARVTLFERVGRARAVGAGIALQANGLAVLHGLGLLEAIDAHAVRFDSFRISDARGRELMRSPQAASLPPELAQVRMLRRSELHEVLLAALSRHPRIEAHWGAEVCGASADGELRVRRAEAEERPTGERPTGERPTDERHRFELVVGADGVHSALRESGDFGARVRRTGTWYVRGLTAEAGAARGEEAWTAAGLFGSFAVKGGAYFYCSAAHPALRAALEQRDVPAFRAAWARAYAPSEPLLRAVPSFDALLRNEVIRVDCRSFVAGRRVLLGDAAHAMAPNLGQGANSALVDAAVLLDELQQAPTLE